MSLEEMAVNVLASLAEKSTGIAIGVLGFAAAAFMWMAWRGDAKDAAKLLAEVHKEHEKTVEGLRDKLITDRDRMVETMTRAIDTNVKLAQRSDVTVQAVEALSKTIEILLAEIRGNERLWGTQFTGLERFLVEVSSRLERLADSIGRRSPS